MPTAATEFDQKVDRARAAYQQSRDATKGATLAARFAEIETNRFREEHKLLVEDAHTGVDRMVAAARNELRDEVAERRGDLCSQFVVRGLERGRLVALWIAATQDEFATEIHRLIDEPDHSPGQASFSPLTAEQRDGYLKRARPHVEQANAAVQDARNAEARAAQAFTTLDRGDSRRGDVKTAEAGAEQARAAQAIAEQALQDVRELLANATTKEQDR